MKMIPKEYMNTPPPRAQILRRGNRLVLTVPSISITYQWTNSKLPSTGYRLGRVIRLSTLEKYLQN